MYQRTRGLSFFPPFIKFLMFANVGVFFLQSFADGFTFGGVPLGSAIMEWFALWPIGENFWPWQFLSYQYLHGGFGHLFFNMFALWMFGMELENMWGSKRFAVYYTLAGIAAGIVHLVVTPLFGGSGAPTIGASGSIMGVLLAFGMLFPDRPVMMFPIFFPIPARFFVLIYAGIDLVMGISNASDGVAHFAHLGGALGGYLLLKLGEPLWTWLEGTRVGGSQSSVYNVQDVEFRDVSDGPTLFYQRPSAPETTTTTEQRATPATETYTRFVVDGERITQEHIDEILDKISQAGYHSLTEREKNILFQVSRQL
ncbi:MAG: rhomboid family intramembrane serine protease [Candidatus Kapaibacteriota bacterium]